MSTVCVSTVCVSTVYVSTVYVWRLLIGVVANYYTLLPTSNLYQINLNAGLMVGIQAIYTSPDTKTRNHLFKPCRNALVG